MIVLGLTGSIGMGKTVAATVLRRVLRIPVHDSDAAVHHLLGPKGAALAAIEHAFPGVVGPGGVDRRRLGARVFGDPAELKRLEAIVHPMVRAETRRWIERQRIARRRMVALDIPLLFETSGERLCDAVLVVSAPAFLQRQRVLRRPGMTPARFAGILAQQMPDSAKRRRADAVIPSGLGRAATTKALRRALHRIARGRAARARAR